MNSSQAGCDSVEQTAFLRTRPILRFPLRPPHDDDLPTTAANEGANPPIYPMPAAYCLPPTPTPPRMGILSLDSRPRKAYKYGRN